MNSIGYIIAIFIFLFTSNPEIAGQGYKLDLNRELALLSGGSMSLAIGLKLKSTILPFDANNLPPYDVNTIIGFDRIATTFNSTEANFASDILGYSSIALPLIFLSHEKAKTDFQKICIVYGEVMLINAGLTSLSKHIFKRPRPYVYDITEGVYSKSSTTAQASFVSGHTSMMASNMFFFARTFETYFPESRLKPVIWTTAIVTPAVMGYLRVKAGVHYPTDVLAGYALGAAVGLIVPALHKKSKSPLIIQSAGNQICLSYRF